jgi:hypothetical protein
MLIVRDDLASGGWRHMRVHRRRCFDPLRAVVSDAHQWEREREKIRKGGARGVLCGREHSAADLSRVNRPNGTTTPAPERVFVSALVHSPVS